MAFTEAEGPFAPTAWYPKARNAMQESHAMRTVLMTLMCALAFVAALGLPASGSAETPEQKAVVGAAADFSVAYGAWLWEKKCQQLPTDRRSAFDATIQDDLKRLSQAADLKLFNAAVGAGQDTANDPNIYKCDDPKAAGFAEFGLKLARDAAAMLSSLPPGYHLAVTN